MPVLYLPKSRPTLPPTAELSWTHTDDLALSERMSTIPLTPTWGPHAEENACRREDLPQVTVCTFTHDHGFREALIVESSANLTLDRPRCPDSPLFSPSAPHNALSNRTVPDMRS